MAAKRKKKQNSIKTHGQSVNKRSPQTRVKLSQAAKRRTRSKGRFLPGKRYAAKEPKKKSPGVRVGSGSNPGMSRGETRAVYESKVQDYERKFHENTQGTARRAARAETIAQYGVTPEATGAAPMRVSSASARKVRQTQRENRWRDESDIYTYQPATRTGKDKKFISPSKFHTEELAPGHREWVEKALADPGSAFNRGLPPSSGEHRTKWSPGARNRVRLYYEGLQEGKSHTEALQALEGERRGRKPGATLVSQNVEAGITRESAGMARPRQAGRKGKFEKPVTREDELGFALGVPKLDSISELKDRFPEMTEEKLYATQQRQREHLFDQFQQNQAWAHETRQANILGKRGKSEVDGDEVTIFTTNLGHPNITVPASSLVGQYVIRQRKKSLMDQGLATRSQLRGRFPQAVRDQHIAEALTGRHFGAYGNVGMYKRGGWRAGSRKSKGFGQPVPVGSQIIYDSAGRPMYDERGNIRFTQGTQRPFAYGSRNEVGLGIYVG